MKKLVLSVAAVALLAGFAAGCAQPEKPAPAGAKQRGVPAGTPLFHVWDAPAATTGRVTYSRSPVRRRPRAPSR